MAPLTRLPSSGRRERQREIRRWSERQRNGQEGRWIQGDHIQDLAATPADFIDVKN